MSTRKHLTDEEIEAAFEVIRRGGTKNEALEHMAGVSGLDKRSDRAFTRLVKFSEHIGPDLKNEPDLAELARDETVDQETLRGWARRVGYEAKLRLMAKFARIYARGLPRPKKTVEAASTRDQIVQLLDKMWMPTYAEIAASVHRKHTGDQSCPIRGVRFSWTVTEKQVVLNESTGKLYTLNVISALWHTSIEKNYMTSAEYGSDGWQNGKLHNSYSILQSKVCQYMNDALDQADAERTGIATYFVATVDTERWCGVNNRHDSEWQRCLQLTDLHIDLGKEIGEFRSQVESELA